LVVALPAAAPRLQPNFVEVDLAGDLEEPLRGAQPDGPGRGIDGREGAVEELLVELGRGEGRAGRFAGRLARFLDVGVVPILVVGRPGGGVLTCRFLGVGVGHVADHTPRPPTRASWLGYSFNRATDGGVTRESPFFGFRLTSEEPK